MLWLASTAIPAFVALTAMLASNCVSIAEEGSRTPTADVSPTTRPRSAQELPTVTLGGQQQATARPAPTATPARTAPSGNTGPCAVPAAPGAFAPTASETHNFNSARVTITQRVDIKRYLISGCTPDEIYGSIARNMPAPEGAGHTGVTISHQDVSYVATSSTSSCVLKSASITLTSTIYVPQLANTSGMDPALLTKWRAFLSGVDIHERGHVDISLNGAKQLQTAFESLPAAASCDALGAAMRAAQERIAASVNARDVAYDRETDHGYTQGPRFP